MKPQRSPFRTALAPLSLFGALALFASLGSPPTVQAQEKPTLTVEDYGQFERLGPATLSPDGSWMAVSISRVNDEGELRIHATDSDSVVVVAYASRPVFSSDNRWLAYSIGVSPDERERMQESRQPVKSKLGLLNLRTGEQETLDDIQSFTFSDNGIFLALRLYKPEGKESDGVDVLVRDMATGSSISHGNVNQMAWQDEGHLLAMTIDADNKINNGVKLYDPVTGRVRQLDSDETTYLHLSWREESGDLVVLKTYSDEEHEDTAHVVLAWRNLDDEDSEAFVLDPREGAGVPAASRVTEFRPPSWSEDGRTIFLGLQEREPVEKGRTRRRVRKVRRERVKARAKRRARAKRARVKRRARGTAKKGTDLPPGAAPKRRKIPRASRSGIRRTSTPCPRSGCATGSCGRPTTSPAGPWTTGASCSWAETTRTRRASWRTAATWSPGTRPPTTWRPCSGSSSATSMSSTPPRDSASWCGPGSSGARRRAPGDAISCGSRARTTGPTTSRAERRTTSPGMWTASSSTST